MRAVRLTLGVVMLGLGGYVVGRALAGARPLSGTAGIDIAFGAFFLLRGAMNLWSARRRPAVPPAGPGVPSAQRDPQPGGDRPGHEGE